MSEKPYYGPHEDENTLNLERFFLAGDFVAGVAYGAQSRIVLLRMRG